MTAFPVIGGVAGGGEVLELAAAVGSRLVAVQPVVRNGTAPPAMERRRNIDTREA